MLMFGPRERNVLHDSLVSRADVQSALSQLTHKTGLALRPELASLVVCSGAFLHENASHPPLRGMHAALELVGRCCAPLLLQAHAVYEGMWSSEELTKLAKFNPRTFSDDFKELLLLGEGERRAGVGKQARSLAWRFIGVAVLSKVDLSQFARALAASSEGSRSEDAKSALLELSQGEYRVQPIYEVVSESGPMHSRTFRVRVSVKRYATEGTGRSKRDAERVAASLLLERLRRGLPARKSNIRAKDPRELHFPGLGAPKGLEETLGYTFRNKTLLQLARIHPSYAHEQFDRTVPGQHYGPLATLGSSLLNAISVIHLANNPQGRKSAETFATLLAAHQKTIASLAREHQVANEVLYGRGAQKQAKSNDLAAQALRALCGAAVVDAWPDFSMSTVRGPVITEYLNQLDNIASNPLSARDPKTTVQEIGQALGIGWTFDCDRHGPSHAETFEAKLSLAFGSHKVVATGRGPAKVEAERAAASMLVAAYNGIGEASELVSSPLVRELAKLVAESAARVTESPSARLNARFRRINLFGKAQLEGLDPRVALGRVNGLCSVLDGLGLQAEDVRGVVAVVAGGSCSRTPKIAASVGSYLDELRRNISAIELESKPSRELLHLKARLPLVTQLLAYAGKNTVATENVRHLVDAIEFARARSRHSDMTTVAAGGVSLDIQYWSLSGLFPELVATVHRSLEGQTQAWRFEIDSERLRLHVASPQMDHLRSILASDVVSELIQCLAGPRVDLVTASELILSIDLQAKTPPLFLTMAAEIAEPEPGLSLVANKLHEVKNLAGVIEQYQSLAGKEPRRRLRHLGDAEETREKCVLLLQGMSRLLGRHRAVFEEFDFASFARDLIADFGTRVPHGVRFEVSHVTTPVVVEADRALLAECITNLLKNATEAVSGGGWVRLDWEHSGNDNLLVVNVSDGGPGIPPAVVEALTQGAVPKSSKPGGSGVGLRAAWDVAKDHDGSLSFASAAGRNVVTLKLTTRRATQL